MADTFLIGPTCVKSTCPSLTKSLIIASVCTILFVPVLSFGVESSDLEALVATATYTAILVVFVGSDLGNGSYGVSKNYERG